MRRRAAFLVALSLLAARAGAAAPSTTATPTPLFSVAVGGNGPLAGEDENRALLPVGGAPASFAVDGDGRWWVLDAIAGRVLVFERDGRIARTLPFPLAAKGQRAFRCDLDLDGEGGIFVVDAAARRVERWSKSGRRVWASGSEKLPKGKGTLDLPRQVVRLGSSLFVADRGSERLVRFSVQGDYQDVHGDFGAVPLPAGGFASIGELDGSPALKITSGGVVRVVARLGAGGEEPPRTALVGVRSDGAIAVAVGESETRVRITLFDAEGATRGEVTLPAPDDDARPVRRWRLTPGGSVAWFRIGEGRFEAYETPFAGGAER